MTLGEGGLTGQPATLVEAASIIIDSLQEPNEEILKMAHSVLSGMSPLAILTLGITLSASCPNKQLIQKLQRIYIGELAQS